MRRHVIALVAAVAVGMASAPAVSTASATPAVVPVTFQSSSAAIAAYNAARDKYADNLAGYIARGRRNIKEFSSAARDYATATKLLRVAKRDIAKTCSDQLKSATSAYTAAKKAGKTPEQWAAALVDHNSAVAAAVAWRESATDSLKPLPAAPPKPGK